MRYRELGSTGLKVSEVGFGGEWLSMDDEGVDALLSRAELAGINILDIWMSDPEMRRKIGDSLKRRGTRDHWVIQGHIGSTWHDGQYVRTRDVPACREAFEDLLSRLGTDHVELGMIHYVDDPCELASILAGGPYLDYVLGLKEQGKIGHVGLSTHNPEVAIAALESPLVQMIMFSSNPAYDMRPASDDTDVLLAADAQVTSDGMEPIRARVYATAARLGKGITAMKPFAGGRLLDAGKSPFGVALTPAHCIHYCLTRPAMGSVMVGFSEPSQVDEAVAYCAASATDKDYASVLAGAPMHAYAGHCIYCGHCAPCTEHIDIPTVQKFYDLAVMQDAMPVSIREHYAALPFHAGDCVGCRDCETRCPFGVGIAARMAAASDYFGY